MLEGGVGQEVGSWVSCLDSELMKERSLGLCRGFGGFANEPASLLVHCGRTVGVFQKYRDMMTAQHITPGLLLDREKNYCRTLLVKSAYGLWIWFLEFDKRTGVRVFLFLGNQCRTIPV